MVFTSLVRMATKTPGNIPGPAKFWGRRRTFMFSAHFYGRRRNCYRNAIRGVIRAFKHATRGRQDKKRDLDDLKNLRIGAACREHGIGAWTFIEAMQRSLVLLNRKVLADLAIWEPRTFKALTDVAKCKAHEDTDLSYPSMNQKDVSHFIDRGFLGKKTT